MKRLNINILPCERFEKDNILRPFDEIHSDNLHIQFGVYIHVSYFTDDDEIETPQVYTCNLEYIMGEGHGKRLTLYSFELPIRPGSAGAKRHKGGLIAIPYTNDENGDLVAATYKINVSTDVPGEGAYQVGIFNPDEQLITAAPFSLEVNKL